MTAEILHEEAVRAGERVSLATVYNTLHQFERAGLLREIAIGGQRAYFDTNTSNHNHFFIEAEGRLVDIPGSSIRVDGLPEPPEHLQDFPHRRGRAAGAKIDGAEDTRIGSRYDHPGSRSRHLITSSL